MRGFRLSPPRSHHLHQVFIAANLQPSPHPNGCLAASVNTIENMQTTPPAAEARVLIEPGFAWDEQDAYLFDIDGTILRDPDRIHMDSFASSIERVTGFAVTLDGIPVHGSTDTAILAEACRRAGIPAEVLEPQVEAILEAMRQTVSARRGEMRLRLMPGVEAALGHLARKGALLGVATGNLETIGWIKIEEAGLREWFRFGGFSDRFPVRAELVGHAALKAERWQEPRPVSAWWATPQTTLPRRTPTSSGDRRGYRQLQLRCAQSAQARALRHFAGRSADAAWEAAMRRNFWPLAALAAMAWSSSAALAQSPAPAPTANPVATQTAASAVAAQAKPIRNSVRRRAAKLYLEGSKLYTAEKFEEAMADYEEAAERDPGNTDYPLAVGVARSHAVTALIQTAAKDRNRGDTIAERAALAHALELDPNNAQVSLHLNGMADDALEGAAEADLRAGSQVGG